MLKILLINNNLVIETNSFDWKDFPSSTLLSVFALQKLQLETFFFGNAYYAFENYIGPLLASQEISFKVPQSYLFEI